MSLIMTGSARFIVPLSSLERRLGATHEAGRVQQPPTGQLIASSRCFDSQGLAYVADTTIPGHSELVAGRVVAYSEMISWKRETDSELLSYAIIKQS